MAEDHPLFQKYEADIMKLIIEICTLEYFHRDNRDRGFRSAFCLFGAITDQRFVLDALRLLDQSRHDYFGDILVVNNAIWATGRLVEKFPHLFRNERGELHETLKKMLEASIGAFTEVGSPPLDGNEKLWIETAWEFLEIITRGGTECLRALTKLGPSEIIFEHPTITYAGSEKEVNILWNFLLVLNGGTYEEEWVQKIQKKFPNWSPNKRH